MIALKQIGLVCALLLIHIYITAQKDTLKHKKYSSKGLYLSAGLSSKHYEYRYFFNRNPLVLDVDIANTMNGLIQYEFSNNIALNIGITSVATLFYVKDPGYDLYDNIWLSDKDRFTIIESNFHFPFYKIKKHGGFHVEVGTSWAQLSGFYTSSNNPNTSTTFRKNSEFKLSSFQINVGIGGEYKFKYFQLYSMVNAGIGLGKLNNNKLSSGTFGVIFGIRLKLPKLFKGTKDRYHWF